MNFFATLIGILSGGTTIATQDTSQPWYINLIISVVPMLVGVAIDIVLAILKNKKIISKEDYEHIKDTLIEKKEQEKINKKEVKIESELKLLEDEENNKKVKQN